MVKSNDACDKAVRTKLFEQRQTYLYLVTFISIRLIQFAGITSSPTGQHGRHFADDIVRCILLNEKFCILINISLQFVPKCPIDSNPALV